MSINYYNTINIVAGEKPPSLLEDWGTRLIKPHQANYGGRTYTLENKTIKTIETSKNEKLSNWNKVCVGFGIILKKLAALFDKKIKEKYQTSGQSLVAAIKPIQMPKKEGDGFSDCLSCCLCCCEILKCILLCCDHKS